jgi:1-acyl-sn-glycerol-3-phosphate acyltransferase
VRVLLILVRRAVLIPALAAAIVISAALLVLAVIVTGPASLCLRGRWRPVRLAAFLVVYLVLEVAALAGALAVWVQCGPAGQRDAVRYQDLNFRLIERLLGRLYRAARWLFGLRVEVRAGQPERQEAGADAVPGPVIVLARHAGPGDTFLLLYALLAYADRRPLLVLKHQLAFDPWIDVLLGRVPHGFIDPSRHGDQAIALISDLAAGMGDRDALVIFPEGGNFTPGRRRRAIDGLRRHGRRRAARQAARLDHVLPPRPSGTLRAIDAAPQADLVIVAHTGLDHLDSAAAVWNGIPLQGPLRFTWWRIPAGDVPSGQDARTEWLNAQWARVDDWIGCYAASSRSKNER